MIPKLQALCARILADKARSLSQKDRYEFLRSIPKHLIDLVKAFPTDVIVWYCNEQLFSTKVMKFYLEHLRERCYITNGYRRDCMKGITRRKVLWMKCSNFYCNNMKLSEIIPTSYHIYWGLCEHCSSYKQDHHILMRLYKEIKTFEL